MISFGRSFFSLLCYAQFLIQTIGNIVKAPKRRANWSKVLENLRNKIRPGFTSKTKMNAITISLFFATKKNTHNKQQPAELGWFAMKHIQNNPPKMFSNL